MLIPFDAAAASTRDMGIGVALVVVASVIIGILYFGRTSKTMVQADAKFATYVSAFTSGNISVSSTIKVRLAEASKSFAGENKPVVEELFSFSPSIDGQTYWLDPQTVEFRPTNLMKSGTIYSAKFALGKVKDVTSEYKTFEFGFRTMEQSFEVQEEGLIIENPRQPDIYTYQGKLLSADYLATAKLAEIMSQVAQTEDNIKAGIQRLMQFQTADGGFMYWPGYYRYVDDWSTCYVGHFLLEAKKFGYSVPDQMISKWKDYQSSAARRWTDETYHDIINFLLSETQK